MIKTSNLSKLYGEVEAVRGINLDIAKGEVVGFLGPNGAGKTTTMRLLTTYLAPSGGSAEVAGFDIEKQPEEVRKRLGYLPESPPLYPEMTVDEYLLFVGQIKGLSKSAAKERRGELVERCGLNEVANRLCANLSKGFKQRVGLAGALIHNPEVIVLDEPTSGLDPTQIIEIRSLIKELADDHTVILSTHILPEVVSTCSSVVIINKGQVVKTGTVELLTKERSLEEEFLSTIIGAN